MGTLRCVTVTGLALALALLSVPATTLAGAPGDLATFQDVRWETYVHRAPDFTLQYPYEWEMSKTERPGEVLSAHAESKAPGVSVSVLPRPNGLALETSAITAARQLNPGVVVESERNVNLGGTPARVLVARWVAPFGAGVSLRTMVVSVFVDQQWVLLFATDGATREGLLPALEQSALSLRFGAAPVSPAVHRARM